MHRDSPLFIGCAAALITPFHKDGTIDAHALKMLVERQMEANMDAIVLLGTTGEPCTLTMKERETIIRIGVRTINGSMPVIIGTGANDTSRAIEYALQAKDLGADGQLCVTPYYNKATQSGLVRHYSKIAESSGLPLILYNVPSRTGLCIAAHTAAELSLHPGIVGIKEASGDVSLAADILFASNGNLPLYCGNDDLILPLMSLGAVGAISVCANAAAAKTRSLTHACLSYNYDQARNEQQTLLPLIRALFSQVNPIPVKAAMHMMGLCEDVLRLPLTSLQEPHRAKLCQVLTDLRLI